MFVRIEAIMKKLKLDKKPLLIALLCGLVVGVFLLAGLFATTDRIIHDHLYFGRRPQADIVIVAIDDSSLQNVGRWPWDRPTMAKLVNALSAAKIIGLDVNFPSASTDSAADQTLANAISAARNVILPVDVTYLSDGRTVASTTAPIPVIADAAASLGHTSITPDVDGIVRRLPLTIKAVSGNYYNAFGEQVALSAGARQTNLPLDASGKMLLPYAGPPGTFRTVSAADVLSGAVPPESFRDQIVLVGGTAASRRDAYRVPNSAALMSGIEIQANLADAMLAGVALRDLPVAWGALICLLLAFAVGLAIPLLRVRTGLIVIAAAAAVYAVALIVAAHFGLFIPVADPILAVALAYVAVTVYRYVAVNRERHDLRSAFEKYVAPTVINSVMAHPDNLALGGERRRMTVLFADLRGFTAFSEHRDAAELITILNGYLNAMTDIIFEEHGVLDKYMGDAIMAFWGAPIEDAHHAERALRSSIFMRDRVVELNRAGYFGAGIGLRAGIGISTGEMVVGNMGSHRHYDYTVLGDAVNLGSRVEELTKTYGVEIIATEETVKGLSKDYVVRQFDRVAVKGKKEPVRLYEVVGFAATLPPEVHDRLDRFARALALYEADDFHGASYAFADILALYPNDEPSRVFWERSNHFLDNPPSPDWNGVWVMETK
jgi:adenylate cyclase